MSVRDLHPHDGGRVHCHSISESSATYIKHSKNFHVANPHFRMCLKERMDCILYTPPSTPPHTSYIYDILYTFASYSALSLGHQAS